MGVHHQLEPVAGGAFMVDVNGRDAVALGQFVEVDAPRRLVFTFGWRDGAARKWFQRTRVDRRGRR
jgi:uncharacterized protein YndB with AHSA1/START domain